MVVTAAQFKAASDVLKKENKLKFSELCERLSLNYDVFIQVRDGRQKPPPAMIQAIIAEYPEFEQYLKTGIIIDETESEKLKRELDETKAELEQALRINKQNAEYIVFLNERIEALKKNK